MLVVQMNTEQPSRNQNGFHRTLFSITKTQS